jgi:AGCS family alanine or glycine:cation symporter
MESFLNNVLQPIVDFANAYIIEIGPSVGGERIAIMVILLLGTGFYLTVRTGFVQFTRLGHGFGVTTGKYDDPDDPGDVSHFQALTTALSATVGIGNIAGVAMAIHWGGPGALFWMWVTALLGMATKYSEVTLAQKYRITDEVGTVAGGPMYYIERGLGEKWKPMAVFFAVMLGFTAFFTGNAVQANTVADQMFTTFGIPMTVMGGITATIVAAVILGGIGRIGRVTAFLAPFMAAVYVAGALLIIFMNLGSVPGAFGTIFREAFNPQAGVAGVGVGVFVVTLMWGVRRGLFSNEAGQGSAPIAHAAAKTDEPVSEGVVALLEPFIDTIVICTMTGLVIVIMDVLPSGVSGASLTSMAFSNAFPGGEYIVTLGLCLFAFTTMIGWSFYGERCIVFLLGARAILPFRVAWVLAVPVGTVVHLDTIWLVADTLNAFMAIPNLVALLLLGPLVFRITREYFERR